MNDAMNDAVNDAGAPLRGLVLTGGHSSRMGQDKALLEVQGVTQLERSVALLEAFVDEVYVSVRGDQSAEPVRSRYRQITDQRADFGPAAGILAAHAYNPDSAWLVVACDMPLLQPGLLSELAERRSGIATAFAGADGQPEPLCAIYEPAILHQMQELAEGSGRLSPRSLLSGQGVHLIKSESSGLLRSANTQQDMKELSEL